jgi:dihydrofolate reductase/thymidylate synthase
MINVIFATDKNLNFCSSDHVSLPWNRHQEDMAFFKKITIYSENGNNAVIMGKKTFDSLCHIPLTNRVNIIVSKTVSHQPIPEGILATTTLRDAINLAHKSYCDNIFIIGGISLITEAFTLRELERIYITTIDVESKIDSIKFNYVIPSPFVKEFTLPISTDAKVNIYVRNKYNSEGEEQYIKLVKDVLSNGESRDDRTGVGTIGVFGRQFTLDISNSFPLLTSKRVFWKGVAEELLFFISGSTDTKLLEAKGVNIWKGNTTREFLDKRGLHNLQEGEYGKSYGYQWRHFGDKVDQLQLLIDGIIKDPYSRRHFMTAWNPLELDNIPLPACHLSCQFYVSKDNKLSCQVYMRSCDIFLGLPFNIASYSLLLYLVSHVTDKKPYEVIFMLGDAHIYLNHIDQIKQQLSRDKKTLPTLKIKRKVTNIDDFKFEDFELENYQPHPAIKAEMAV